MKEEPRYADVAALTLTLASNQPINQSIAYLSASLEFWNLTIFNPFLNKLTAHFKLTPVSV